MGEFEWDRMLRFDALRRPDSAGEINAKERSQRLRYGGEWFAAASSLPLDRGLIRSGMLLRFLAACARSPRRFAALIALLIGTRREYVPLSDSPHGEGLRSYFNRRSSGFRVNRFCRGVLVLPDDHATYLRGRRREALRRNLRKAARASIRCELVSDRSRAAADLLELLGGRPEPPAEADLDGWYRFVALPELQFVVARDPAGAPVAVAGVVIDETVCLLRLALANSHEARWMLHDYLVQLLIARRVKYLVSEGGGPFGALGFSPGVQHYQHLLGYELLHVIPERARVRLRRTVASLTTIAGTVSLVVAGVASCGSAT